ncbi:DUF2790 domain-containing protein [Pseudomonas entomophila]|uniref:DUF2790 domain-containing protein n=1 Tax=Pseudomonas entomophila TaxID=312306 RepID=UPI00200DB8E6|nr:DUF2790 domain-containing protein [Pseudomonas entomophila]
MNAKAFARVSLFALLSLGAIAAQAATQQAPKAMPYHYGERLDVKKVLSIQTDPNVSCGVANSRMNYLDSQGRQHDLQYLTYATDGCHEH